MTAIYRGLEHNRLYELIPSDPDVWLRAAYLDIKNQCLTHIPAPGLTVGPVYINVSEQDPVKAMTEALEWTIRDIYKMLVYEKRDHLILYQNGFILFDDVPGGRVSC